MGLRGLLTLRVQGRSCRLATIAVPRSAHAGEVCRLWADPLYGIPVTTENRDPNAVIRDGAEWPEHEDRLIGNEAGLRNLRRAIDVALDEGEYSGADLDEWVGVRRVTEEWISREIPSRQQNGGRFEAAAIISILATLVGLIAIGLWTVATWIF